MKIQNKIKYSFFNIEGVLLTDGWSPIFRASSAGKFNIDILKSENLQHIEFDVYEEDKLSLEYLKLIVLYNRQSFSEVQFRSFKLTCSKAYPKMIDLIRNLRIGSKI